MRNSSRNTTNYKSSTNSEKLLLVRSSVMYGLSFETVKQEKISYNTGITSVPTIIFFNNNTQCFIDFTNQRNEDVEVKVKTFFSKVANGTTFYILNGQYSNPNNEETADISGEFIFTEYFNGIIKANVVSVNDFATGVTRYDKKYFEDIPIISVSSLTTEESKNITVIRNIFGSSTKNSFDYLGIKVGDFISFSEFEGKYQILEITKDPNGIETLKISGKLNQKFAIDTKILISVYIRYVDQYTDEPDVNEIQLGACVRSSNGVIIDCLDNHTSSQCRFRSSAIDGIDSTISFGAFCSTPETDTSVQLSTTDQLVKITNLLASNIAIATTNIANVAGPVNRNGNSRSGFYGRS